MAVYKPVSRRLCLQSSGLLLGAAAVPWTALRLVHAAGATPPQLEQGIQIGDVRADRVVIWGRSTVPPASWWTTTSPYAGLQFFGQVDIQRRTGVMLDVCFVNALPVLAGFPGSATLQRGC